MATSMKNIRPRSFCNLASRKVCHTSAVPARTFVARIQVRGRWQKAQAYLIAGGPGAGSGGPIMTTYLLLLEFNENNVLLRAELKSKLLTTRSSLDEALLW
jgi:hypothetical protein